MNKLLIISLLFAGCATQPLTEAEMFERMEHEQLRQELWPAWVSACTKSGGFVLANGPQRSMSDARCRNLGDCVPKPIDWDFKEYSRPDGSTAYWFKTLTYKCTR